jgi:hypothetical protein
MYYTLSRRSIVDSFLMQCSSNGVCSNGEAIGLLLEAVREIEERGHVTSEVIAKMDPRPQSLDWLLRVSKAITSV